MMGYTFGRAWGGITESAVEGALAVHEVARAAYGAEGVAAADPDEPDASPDPDEIEALGDRIATLAAHIHAAEGEMLPLIARYERLGGWERAGHKSCAHWLSFRTGYCLNAARERVRVARALDDLPVDPVTLSKDSHELGRAELEDGTRVSAETCRRIACDAGIVRVEHDETGAVLNVGRRSRSTPTAIRRALDVRDRGCRFPGCGVRFTQPHHVEQWTDGGETSLRNTVLLCRYHHRLVHEGGWGLEWWPHGRVAFIDLRGTIHVGSEKPRPPRLPKRPAEALVRQQRLNGVEPDGYSASARWKRERDIPDAVLFRATEAGLS